MFGESLKKRIGGLLFGFPHQVLLPNKSTRKFSDPISNNFMLEVIFFELYSNCNYNTSYDFEKNLDYLRKTKPIERY